MESYVNVSAAYSLLGQFGKALPFAQKSVELQPENGIASENLVVDYLGLGRMAEARTELERARKLGLDSGSEGLMTDMQVYFLQQDTQAVQGVLSEVAGRPDEFMVTQALAAMQQFDGQYAKAAATTQQAFEQAGRAKAPDVQAAALLLNALARGLVGLCEGSDAVVQQALALDKSKLTQAYAGFGGWSLR